MSFEKVLETEFVESQKKRHPVPEDSEGRSPNAEQFLESLAGKTLYLALYGSEKAIPFLLKTAKFVTFWKSLPLYPGSQIPPLIGPHYKNNLQSRPNCFLKEKIVSME